MGMTNLTYWTSWLISSSICSFVITSVLIIIGYLLKLSFFINTPVLFLYIFYMTFSAALNTIAVTYIYMYIIILNTKLFYIVLYFYSIFKFQNWLSYGIWFFTYCYYSRTILIRSYVIIIFVQVLLF